MQELPPDRRWTHRAPWRLRRRRARNVRSLQRARHSVVRLLVRAAREPTASTTIAAAVMASIEVMLWLSRPRSRVVYRARIDPGDHLEIRGVTRR